MDLQVLNERPHVVFPGNLQGRHVRELGAKGACLVSVQEGEIVIFSPAVEVNSGDDCFVRFAMPHESTFKRVFFESEGNMRLQPRNDKYAPEIVDGKRVNGLYRAVVRYEKL